MMEYIWCPKEALSSSRCNCRISAHGGVLISLVRKFKSWMLLMYDTYQSCFPRNIAEMDLIY
jgi:hypothetical protein